MSAQQAEFKLRYEELQKEEKELGKKEWRAKLDRQNKRKETLERLKAEADEKRKQKQTPLYDELHKIVVNKVKSEQVLR